MIRPVTYESLEGGKLRLREGGIWARFAQGANQSQRMPHCLHPQCDKAALSYATCPVGVHLITLRQLSW